MQYDSFLGQISRLLFGQVKVEDQVALLRLRTIFAVITRTTKDFLAPAVRVMSSRNRSRRWSVDWSRENAPLK